jgi:hypothetical protein
LTDSLDDNVKAIKDQLAPSDDLHTRDIQTPLSPSGRAVLIYFHPLVDIVRVENSIVAPLNLIPREYTQPPGPPKGLETLLRGAIASLIYKVVDDVASVAREMAVGSVILLVDGFPQAAAMLVDAWPSRQVQEPPSETTIRGPHEGFTESLEDNIALVRRRIKDPRLALQLLEVGRRSRSRVAVMYVADLVRPELIREVLSRLGKVNYGQSVDASFVTEMIGPHRWTVFPRYMVSGRPDRVAAGLQDGRVAILVEGDPEAILIPSLFMEFFTTPDDYYFAAPVASFLRFMRILGALIVLFLPAIYISVAAYNPDVMRVELALVIAGTREGVPLSVVIEVLVMEIFLEMFQEATVRLPSRVGTAATVVGGLIIGQAAAQARLISNIMVIIVAVTAIGSFTTPSYDMALAVRLTRWVMIAAATIFGLYGVTLAAFLLVIYLNSTESFGVPYLAPYSPLQPGGLASDSVIRKPWWKSWLRPKAFAPRGRRRGAPKSDEGGEW